MNTILPKVLVAFWKRGGGLSENGLKMFLCPSDIKMMSPYEQLMSMPEMAEFAMDIDVGNYLPSKKVCIFGIGESSIAGDIMTAYADDYSDYPVVSISNGIIPKWVGNDTDVIIVSYTGDNLVTNCLYEKLKKNNQSLTCITSGGSIKEKCKMDNVKVLDVPTGLSSRSALGFEIGLLSSILQKMGICDIHDRLSSLISVIKKYRDSLFEDVRVRALIPKLVGKTAAFYGSPDFCPSFRRWKMSFNKDIGSFSFCGELPEFNHNEIVGWANHNQNDGDLRIVFLRGKYKNEVLTTIVDKTMEVLEESGRHVMDLRILGDDPLEKNLRAILLGDYISQMIGNRRNISIRRGVSDV